MPVIPETTPEPEGGQEPQTGAVRHPWEDPVAARAEIEKLRKEAASYRTKVRELEPAAAELAQLRQAGRSEAEKLAERAAAAEKEAATARSELLRSQVALAKGLTEAQARRLMGSTREEMEADAAELVAAFASPAVGGQEPCGGGPLMQPDPSQGSGADAGTADPAQIFAGLIRNTLHH